MGNTASRQTRIFGAFELKRALDIIFAIGAIAATSPLWLLAGAIILCADQGSYLFTQPRIGKDGRPFKIYKFRTMYLREQDSGSVTTRGDSRVFPGGLFLRKYKLDELPQLLNVLNGTMSLVGPRPTVDEDCQRMDETQRRRLEVSPGITGLAQISGNTSLPWRKRIEYDLVYIDNWSLWLDLKILLHTAWLVVSGRAETHPPGEDEWEER